MENYLADILHYVSQGLLYPTIIILLLLVLYGLWCIGSIFVESFLEHRHFKLVMPDFLKALDKASVDEVASVVGGSGLLGRQKKVLLEIFSNRGLPEESRYSLAKRLIFEENEHYEKVVGRTDAASKIGPMFGLMGTLIPLGPGIVALSSNDLTTLSNSLLIAFDTTVAGLIVAAVCYLVSKVRKRWYANYMVALKTSAETLLEKIDILEEQGAGDGTQGTAAAPSAGVRAVTSARPAAGARPAGDDAR